MDFRANLIKKIQINALAHNVLRSINPADSGQRVDREAMRQLLDMGGYDPRKERDLDFYILEDGSILVLDNELKIYKTTIEDVALRKSPTVKEMVSIRNAIKILNDKDVVVSRKGDTVQRVQKELIDHLDLAYTPDDIAAMAKDGMDALKNSYTDGVVEILSLFAELLGYKKAPKAFQIAHHQIWGKSVQSQTGEVRFGPAVLFGLMHNSLKMCNKAVISADRESLHHFHQIAKGERDADLSGNEVLEALQKAVLSQPQDSAR